MRQEKDFNPQKKKKNTLRDGGMAVYNISNPTEKSTSDRQKKNQTPLTMLN
jgi:hypothetical protein